MGLFGPPDISKLKATKNVAGLIRALRHDLERTKREAAIALGEIPDALSLEPLLVAVTENDYDVRDACVKALERICDSIEILPLSEPTESSSKPNSWLKFLDWQKSQPSMSVQEMVRCFGSHYTPVCKAAEIALALRGSDIVDQLVSALDNSNAQVRAYIAKTLRHFKHKTAMEALSKCFTDSNADVRENAAESLGEIGGVPVAGPLAGLLGDTSTRVRMATMVALKKIAAVEFHIESLKNPAFDVRKNNIEILAELGDRRATEALINILNDPKLGVRSAAVDALAKLGDTRAIVPLHSVLMNDPHLRKEAEAALYKLGWQPGSDEAGARYWIWKQEWDRCAEIGSLAVVPLIESLTDPNSYWRAAAVTTLGKIGDPRCADQLISLLKDESNQVRQCSIEALGEIADVRAMEPLIDLLQSLMPSAAQRQNTALDSTVVKSKFSEHDLLEFRDSIFTSLEKLGWQPGLDYVGASYWVWKHDWDVCVEIGSLAIQPLREVLMNPDTDIVVGAVGALGGIADENSIELLIGVLSHSSSEVRKRAILALSKIQDERVLPTLVQCFRDSDKGVRDAVLSTLLSLDRDKAVDMLVRTLSDISPELCEQAVEELGRIEGESAVAGLLVALEHSSGTIRMTAAGILDGLGWKPDPDEVGARYWIAKGDWNKCGEIGTAGLMPVLELLNDSGTTNREAIIGLVGKIGDSRAFGPLMDNLKHCDGKIRRAAAGALEALGWIPTEDVNGALYWLASEDWRRCAALGAKAMKEALIQVLKNEDILACEFLVYALGDTGDTAVVPILVNILRDSERPVSLRKAAVVALENLGGPYASSALYEALFDDSDPEILDSAEKAFFQPEPFLLCAEDLKRLTEHWLSKGKLSKCFAYGSRIVDALISTLDHADRKFRTWATYALGFVRDARAIEPLISKLADVVQTDWYEDSQKAIRFNYDTSVREAAIGALSEIGREAVLAVEKAAKATDEWVSSGAKKALRLINDRDHNSGNEVILDTESLISGLKNPDPLARASAATNLRVSADTRALEALIESLGDPSKDVRREAAESLGHIADVLALEPLIKALSDSDESVRSSVVRALGAIHDPRAIDPLKRALNDYSIGTRRVAIQTICLFNDARAVEVILSLLKGPLEEVRVNVGLGFARSRGVARTYLDSTLKDANSEIYGIMVQWLGGEIHHSQALSGLKFLLNRGKAEQQMAAVEALCAIGSASGDTSPFETLAQMVVDSISWSSSIKWGTSDREFIVHAIGRIGGEQAVDALIGLIRKLDTNRWGPDLVEPIRALGRIGDKRAVKILTQVLQADYGPKTGHAAAEALGNIGDVEVIDTLIKILPKYPLYIAKALGNLGDIRAAEPIADSIMLWGTNPYTTGDWMSVVMNLLRKLGWPAPVGGSGTGDRLGSLQRDLLETVEKLGEAEVCFNRATMYANRSGLLQNFKEAVRWYRLAADAGHAEALYQLGFVYYCGRGVLRDYTEAAKWCRRSADSGHAAAQNLLAFMYQYGQGVSQNYREAINWFRQAADQGNSDAQSNMGFMCLYGLGVGQDYREAMRWYRLSADQGNATAQSQIGYIYQNSLGVKQDYGEAIKWYRLSAGQGNAGAQYQIGFLYQMGLGVKQDYGEAIKWYRLSAGQGNAGAQSQIGYLYHNALGVAQDYREAMRWYRLAADQGNAVAQNQVGFLYQMGLGVKQDNQEAMRWYRLAADQGNATAKSNLAAIQKM
jgi:HEAT repeat protein/TPR repeat protein